MVLGGRCWSRWLSPQVLLLPVHMQGIAGFAQLAEAMQVIVLCWCLQVCMVWSAWAPWFSVLCMVLARFVGSWCGPAQLRHSSGPPASAFGLHLWGSTFLFALLWSVCCCLLVLLRRKDAQDGDLQCSLGYNVQGLRNAS